MFKILNSFKQVNYIRRNINVYKFLQNEDKSHKRKVKETIELVTLVDENDKILGLRSKAESELLAKKLKLTLERVTDTKYGKIYPAYKMLSTSDVLKTEKKTSTAKVLKKLPLNSRISDHDLSSKINIIRKWLAKNCEVHVAILRNKETDVVMKKVLSKIQNELKDECRILDIRQKEEAIKFIATPPKKVASKSNKNENKVVNSTEDD